MSVVGACHDSVAEPLVAGVPVPVDEVEDVAAAEPVNGESPPLQPASSVSANTRTKSSFSDFKAHPHAGARPSGRTRKFIPVKLPSTAEAISRAAADEYWGARPVPFRAMYCFSVAYARGLVGRRLERRRRVARNRRRELGRGFMSF